MLVCSFNSFQPQTPQLPEVECHPVPVGKKDLSWCLKGDLLALTASKPQVVIPYFLVLMA